MQAALTMEQVKENFVWIFKDASSLKLERVFGDINGAQYSTFLM